MPYACVAKPEDLNKDAKGELNTIKLKVDPEILLRKHEMLNI